MRWTRIVGVASALGAVGAGCFDYYGDCQLALTCSPGTGGSSSSTGTMSSSSGTTGGGTPEGCDPSKASKPVAGSCGVFVSPSGDDGNAGTKEKPVKTITAALGKGATIYACAGAMPFSEAVTISKAATLYGALDCASWAYDASKKTQLTAKADVVPLTIGSGGDGAEVDDFAITAAGAMSDGGSSIAVVASSAAGFARCDLTAGDAKDGLPGASGGAQAMQANPGLPGDDAASATMNGGGAGSNAACSLNGGKGGDGGQNPTGNGGDGFQGDGSTGGTPGTKDTGAGCTPGGQGPNGTTPGFGLGAASIGTIDGSGYHGSDGEPGMDGTHGASGGGGGGSKASVTVHGAGGGGGGAGGCGGKHGEGGKAAGSSIALVSLSAMVTMTGCTLKTGKGASGGAGGDGQFGQHGGAAGPGGMGGSIADGCSGGAGGKGGDGGNGGGGLGGHSLGIASTGTAPMLDAATKAAITPGMNGKGGLGGNMDEAMNHGADGLAAACWDFGTNAACK